MTAATDQELKRYVWAVRRRLPGTRRERDKICRDLSDSINQYRENVPDASMEDIIAQFGSPEDFTAQYLSHLSAEDLAGRFRAKRLRNVCIIIVSCAVLAVCLYLARTIYIEHSGTVVYYKEYLEILESETGLQSEIQSETETQSQRQTDER